MPLPGPPTVWDCCTRAGGIPETAARRSTFNAGRVDNADLPPIHHLQAGHVLPQPRATRTTHAGSLSDTPLAPAAAGYRLRGGLPLTSAQLIEMGVEPGVDRLWG
jgi:hypothetical protein